MLITRTNKEGYIYAYFEWDIVNQHGQTTDNGHFMYVRDLWVHPNYDGRLAILDFIKELDNDARNRDVLWIYWERNKNGKRISKSFRRITALRRILWEVLA
jgi:hypothetical protein